MDIKQFAGDGVDDMTDFDAFYDEVIRRLGGVALARLEAETRIRGRLVEAPFPGSLRF